MPVSSALSLRISPKDRLLIDRAAEAVNKSRTEFMLDSARKAATDALLDQRLFLLDGKDFAKFEKAVAVAPKAREISKQLKSRPSPWKS